MTSLIQPIPTPQLIQYNREIDFPKEEYNDRLAECLHEYLTQLNDTQLKAYRTAKRHLGSSFDLAKSNGFVGWMKARK
jgi:hypothetical protein